MVHGGFGDGPSHYGGRVANPAGETGDSVFEAIETAVLGSPPRFTPADIYESTGTAEEVARQLWLAMGFPHIPPGEAVLTERDRSALAEAQGLLGAGFELPLVVRQARVMSQAVATVAASQVETLGLGRGHDAAVGGVAGEGTGGVAGDAGEMLATFDRLLVYLYRRHLVAALERAALMASEGGGEAALAVGFADLAGFSSTASEVSAEEVADLVDTFAAAAADAVAEHGGRVIKLIGDEVLFSVDDPAAAAGAVLEVVDAADRIEGGLPVHAGVAYGPVHQHLGDVFGVTVNRASRLTDAARPGSVLVDEALRDRLAGDDRFSLKRVHLRPLKGLGPVRPYVLRRSMTDDTPASGDRPSTIAP